MHMCLLVSAYITAAEWSEVRRIVNDDIIIIMLIMITLYPITNKHLSLVTLYHLTCNEENFNVDFAGNSIVFK